ncbi:hypothetical protein M0G43_00150 [Subsaxibacter sp. CAU 1640]|uniref:hypothetical protein n=1 Tax=Subsaxibacter sp. CAU 1640 TaxID=2933271 RepID=UPI002004DF9C|nr:hypothetical protein [Subsaxibacter sp. CAU 1640]MCK7588974.1 hypothetical protein [Subsaxibacter sp. CAU 1640]
MKKFNLLAVILLLVVSCQKDEDALIPVNEAQTIIDQNITDTTVFLEWEDANVSSYRVEYGIKDFTFGEGMVAVTDKPSIELTNLIPDTTYDYYVRPVYIENSTNANRSVHIRRFTTRMAPVVTEFRPNLSQMRLFRGALNNLTPSPYAFVYDLNTRLYTDYALKQRIIALPLGTSMVSNGDGLPDFPDNTVIAKTFYYNIDDRDLDLGRKLIETRVMIKINGNWEFGNYVWNEDQTDAVLDNVGSTTPITWIDVDGMSHNVNYKIPSAENCFTCHQSYNVSTPIGPKLRSMNFDINGMNQLQKLINDGELTGISDLSSLRSLPDWEDTNLSDETRVRAYLDMNCAHCHSFGGFHTFNYYDALNVAYETSFDNSHILEKRLSILSRIQTSIEDYSMPYIGVTTPHQEALDVIVPYLESLED